MRLIPNPAVSLEPPTSESKAVKLPEVAAENPYTHARETDSAIVQVTSPLGKHYEKFLFYRGLGNFILPVHLTAREKESLRSTTAALKKSTGYFLFPSAASRCDSCRPRI